MCEEILGEAADPEQVQACWNLLKDPTFIKETGLRSTESQRMGDI